MKKNYKIFFVFLLLATIISCNNYKKNLVEDKVYLIFRDSESKVGFFVKKFNLSNIGVTHVGFLLFKNGSWYVWHAANVSKGNCIKVEKIEHFTQSDNEKLKIRILEILDFKKKDLLLLKLDSVHKKNLKFDFSFSEHSENAIYCSKLVVDLLNNIDRKKYIFLPHAKKLNNIEKAFLKKDTLKYYPVDMFFYDTKFTDVK